ncbi:MAG: winged helix-turn-helix transcriptional regulator [Phycisphaerae bacterium]|nr:winged helix-turn-helix transcriptional regulator [Phycisphaerae bacterium]
MNNQLKLLSDETFEKAAECLKVMAHPARLKIVNILMQGEFPVHEIAQLCNCTPNQTCEHLRLLKGQGLLASQRKGRAVYYEIISPQLPGLINCISKNCVI